MKKMVMGLVGVAVMGSVFSASATEFPLNLDIDVASKIDRESVGAEANSEAKWEKVQVRVKIRKSGGQAYDRKLTAELYVIGQQIQTGYYGIIDILKEEFSFTAENDHTFEFTSNQYALPQLSGNADVGGTYETYLVVIVDDAGDIIDSRSGRVIREKGIDFIRELGEKTLFDRDGNVVGRIDEKSSVLKVPIREAPPAEE